MRSNDRGTPAGFKILADAHSDWLSRKLPSGASDARVANFAALDCVVQSATLVQVYSFVAARYDANGDSRIEYAEHQRLNTELFGG